jgi:hypothetical protein
MRKVVLAVVFALVAGGAQAATLDVVGSVLHGAFGVDVGGTLYDVEFVDGTCIDVFNGCDDLTDFTFTDAPSATLASEALLDQVFLDGPSGNFDSDPALTNGCPSLFSGQCFTWVPYTFNTVTLFGKVAVNVDPSIATLLDRIGNASAGITTARTDTIGYLTYSRWSTSSVPEPSTALLLSLGLTGLAAKGRRRSRS